MLFLAPLWLVAGLITGVAEIGRGRPVFVYNMLDLERFRWSGPSLGEGKHTIASGIEPGSRTVVLIVQGRIESSEILTLVQVQAHQTMKPYQQLRYGSNIPFRHGSIL